MVSAMGYDNFLEDQYHVPFLAKILHSLPHLNISLHRTNNTFRPTDEIYLEVIHKIYKFMMNLHQFPFRFYTEFGPFGIYTGSSSHIFPLLSPTLLNVTMLRSKTSPSAFHYEPESYVVNRNCAMLCRDRFG